MPFFICIENFNLYQFLECKIKKIIGNRQRKNDNFLNYSSGETIERVGLLKYRMLELT